MQYNHLHDEQAQEHHVKYLPFLPCSELLRHYFRPQKACRLPNIGE